MSHNYYQNLLARAVFDPQAMQKVDVFRTERLFIGLNCVEQGQSQRAHTHEAADKFYLVLRGKARITVSDDTNEVGPGGLVWVPAGTPHGIAEALEQSVILVGMAPAPDTTVRSEG